MLRRLPRPHRPTSEARQPAFERVEQIAVAHQDPHQRDQVAAVPMLLHVRFAGADAAVQRDFAIERGVTHPDGGVQRQLRVVRGRAEHDVDIGVDQTQLAIAQCTELRDQSRPQRALETARRGQRGGVEVQTRSLARDRRCVLCAFVHLSPSTRRSEVAWRG
jgi:hypothetical protein